MPNVDPSLLRVLRPYQEEAVDRILDQKKIALWIDMGLGKTAIILFAILELLRRKKNPLKGKVLLCGPIRVIETVWETEAKDWLATRGITFTLLRGSPAERQRAAQEDTDIYMCNPELLEEALDCRKDFAMLVIDEASMFKNPSSRRFKVLRKRLKKFERIVTATGTPGRLLDLWSQSFIIDNGDRLDTSYGRYKDRYFYPTDWQGYVLEPHEWAREEILEELSDIVFRVSLAEAALDLKDPIHNIVKIRLPAKARKIYDDMEKRALAEINRMKVITAATAATKMMKLRQIAGGFVYDEDGKVSKVHDEKIRAVEEIIESSGEEPIIVVYQFVEELAALKKAFPHGVTFGKRGPGWDKLHKLSERQRDAWNAKKIPLMFMHPQSGGHGLNLQKGGRIMVFYSGSFSYEQMDQIMKRLDRSGQDFAVVYHWLAVENSVDNLILEVLDVRKEDQSTTLKLIKEYAKRHGQNDCSGGTGRSGKVDAGPVPRREAPTNPRPHRWTKKNQRRTGRKAFGG